MGRQTSLVRPSATIVRVQVELCGCQRIHKHKRDGPCGTVAARGFRNTIRESTRLIPAYNVGHRRKLNQILGWFGTHRRRILQKSSGGAKYTTEPPDPDRPPWGRCRHRRQTLCAGHQLGLCRTEPRNDGRPYCLYGHTDRRLCAGRHRHRNIQGPEVVVKCPGRGQVAIS